MRISALARVVTALTAATLASTFLGMGSATADDPALPVVVPDTITLYPAQSDVIDVLANDTGDDLALCRFPELDFLSSSGFPSVVATHSSSFLGGTLGPGEIAVTVMPRAHGTHTVDYYVCDHTRLVPATLTVVVREVAPVDVRKVPGKPGRLKVTNHNTVSIQLWYGDPRAEHPDAKPRVPAGATRTVRVRRHQIAWVAVIGSGSGKGALLSSPGLADQGVVRHIKLDGKPLPRPKKPKFDIDDLLGRWRG